MPEGPEVQTVVSTLEKQIKFNRITEIQIPYPKIVENQDKDFFVSQLLNNQFIGFHRMGKFIVLQMERGFLIIHLRMEGKFYIDLDQSIDKHTHLVFKLDDGRYLKYSDTRKFGRLAFVHTLDEHPGLSRLGPDVLDPQLTGSILYQKLNHRSIPIKQALLDQSIVTGIGNIYANEICFDAKVHPSTTCNQLSLYNVRQILKSSRKIISEAISMGGTTIRSYTSSLNVHGRFDQELKVHLQENCEVCQSEIQKIYINKRGTYFCPKCQKLKK